MAITSRKITTYADNIVDLADRPNEDGISADQLKAIFDGRGDKEIKDSINGIVDDLVATTDGASGADQIGSTALKVGGAETVQSQLEETLANVEAHKANTTNPHVVTKFQVGLGNADDTSDINKPVSTAHQAALNLKADLASPTFTGEPKAPNIGVGASNQQIANVQYVKDTVVDIGAADMAKAIYDPNNVEQNIFDVDSHVSGTINKVFTSTEKDKLESVGKLSGKETVFSGNVITETRADGSTLVTTFNGDGTITEQLTVGLDVTSKQTTFNADGSISEVLI